MARKPIDVFLNKIKKGHNISIVRKMPTNIISTTVTSPPYWGAVRNYGTSHQIYTTNPKCYHEWKNKSRKVEGKILEYLRRLENEPDTIRSKSVKATGGWRELRAGDWRVYYLRTNGSCKVFVGAKSTQPRDIEYLASISG